MSYYNQPFSSSLPPPPMEAPPKPPRRVSTVMNPTNLPVSGDDARPPMMKRLTRVLSTRRLSAGNPDDAIDPCANCHIDALYGRIGVVSKAINRDNAIVIQPFSFRTASLLSPEEEDNEFYIPPPALPKLVRLTLKKPVEIMTLDQRWLLQHAFAESTLLHYACAGDQYDVVKLLLEKGADWTLVNGSNKTAEMYTADERIRDLFTNAEDKYTPYNAPSKQPAPTSARDSPMASPPSILKRGNSSRRRQSVINDSSWADNNLRTTVHQVQLLNIRPTNSPSSNSPAPSTNASITTSPVNTFGAPSRRPTLAARSRPEPEEYVNDNTPPPRSLARMKSDMGSVYSNAEVINTLSELELDPDVTSVASHNSAGTTNTAASSVNRKRLSFRRGSRIVQALREKDPVLPASTAPATGVRVPPPPPPPTASTTNTDTNTNKSTNPNEAAPSAQSRKSIKSMKKLLADEVVSLASSSTTPSRLSARPLPASPLPTTSTTTTVVHRVPPPPPPTTNNSSDIANEDSVTDGNKGEENTTSSRKSMKNKRGSETQTLRHPPPPPTSTDNATLASGNDNAKRASSKRAKAEAEPVTPPPPPLRVMRRLSVNMSVGAVEAASYIEGADGTHILSTTVLGADSPEKCEPKHVHVASPETKTTPPEMHPGSNSLKSKTSEVRVSHVLRNLNLAAELGDESYQEAWETKAVADTNSDSPFAKLQSSMKTGADDGLWVANRLIARATQMEKAEAREAKYHQAKAERLQGLLSKLTPLENIASGVLLKGRTAEELSRDNILDGEGDDDLSPDLSHHQAGGSLAATLFGATGGTIMAPGKDYAHESSGQSSAEKKQSQHVQQAYLQTGGGQDTPTAAHRNNPAPEPFHSLSFRDMIWHRAAQHMNSALSDKQRSHYDKARLEAYQLGLKLMKKEFSTMANQEHWEAVDLVEAQRQQAAEKQLKENVRAFMLTNHDTHDARDTSHVSFTPTMHYSNAGAIVEQVGGRNSSFVPFARSSVSTLFCDEESD